MLRGRAGRFGTQAIGLFQLHALEPGFSTAEWGFALGMPHWGSGIFVEAAALVAGFTFGSLGVSRLEARAAVGNGRGNGALRKLGAVREAILRDALHLPRRVPRRCAVVDSRGRLAPCVCTPAADGGRALGGFVR